MKHNKVKDSNKKGEKFYAYQLDGQALDELRTLIKRRETIGSNGWDFVNKTYGFTYPDSESVLEMYQPSRRKRRQVPLQD